MRGRVENWLTSTRPTFSLLGNYTNKSFSVRRLYSGFFCLWDRGKKGRADQPHGKREDLQLSFSTVLPASLLVLAFSIYAILATYFGQASLSFTISWSLPKLLSTDLVMLSSRLILCQPLFLLPSIFLSIRLGSGPMPETL